MSPPIDFGAAWRNAGTHRRYGHDLTLWLCDERTQEFFDAYRGARAELTGAGYSWTDRGRDRPALSACWWDTGIAVDLCGLANAADLAIRTAAADRAEKANAAAERLAREVAEVAPEAAPIRTELTAMEGDRPWSFGRQLGDVRQLLGDNAWGRSGLQYAERLFSNAKGNITRAAARLGRPGPATWFARAADPDIRAAALSLCRILSALDTDWAAVRNSAGWSRATTWTGHTLAEMGELDQAQAAHALGLLHGHRRQLPDELCTLLFGSAPTRRRRSAPSDAPSLGL
ncbi:hypothetical protein [Methylobacterium pseudosasicola]|uniref:Uncharacterized protein n=1 Tax=Methylobacterium pseudosasicola TaxID=582667 RepID=A0A1I4U7C9_9HYPH|nr:hypothetical protein [Methylobacterium pseudosasicola]SFM84721.1 hypothetical protein SAMN05192568_10647 [Methylobacterium pseudosasicola]